MTEQSDVYSVASVKPGKRVSFSNTFEQKTYGSGDGDVEVKIFNDKSCILLDKDEEIHNISFGEKSTKFVIEDRFYKIPYKLAKNVDEIRWFKNEMILKNKINDLLSNLETYHQKIVYRLDGILVNKFTKQLVVLTELLIFDFIYKENNYIFTRTIYIDSIDYITLTRNYKK